MSGGGGVDLPLSPAYNVKPITNISSLSCVNNGQQMPQCPTRLPPWLNFSHFATHTVDRTVDRYAAKPDVRPESSFLPTPPAFDGPIRGVPVRISPPRLVWQN